MRSAISRRAGLIAAAIEQQLPTAQSFDILDAGCGTGLCGPLLRSRAKHLVGVDLSAGMLQQATARGVYDELVEQELTAFLLAQPLAFDLIASADTLNYFGDLRPLFTAVHQSLRPGGWLFFTLERDESEATTEFRLQTNGRYCHHEARVRSALSATGFASVTLSHATLRREADRAVAGLLVAAHRSHNELASALVEFCEPIHSSSDFT